MSYVEAIQSLPYHELSTSDDGPAWKWISFRDLTEVVFGDPLSLLEAITHFTAIERQKENKSRSLEAFVMGCSCGHCYKTRHPGSLSYQQSHSRLIFRAYQLDKNGNRVFAEDIWLGPNRFLLPKLYIPRPQVLRFFESDRPYMALKDGGLGVVNGRRFFEKQG